jgi:hypothetical protein
MKTGNRLRAVMLCALTSGAVSCGGNSTGSEPPGPPARLEAISPPTARGEPGEVLPDSIVVRVVDADGRGVPGHAVAWRVAQFGGFSVSPVEVLTDAKGRARTSVVLGGRIGKFRLTAEALTTEGGSTTSFDIEVAPGAPATIHVIPDSLDLGIGGVAELAAIVSDAKGNTVTPSITWSSSSAAVARVTAGRVEAVGVGRAEISARVAGLVDVVPVVVKEYRFRDTFDGENGGQAADNFVGFRQWDVTRGSVDLVGTGRYDDFLPPENGSGVDLDGSSSAAGTLQTKSDIVLAPGSYLLTFQLAGCPRLHDPNTVRVSLGSLYSESFTINSFTPLRTYSRTITVAAQTSAKLTFSHAGGDDFGILLDNVGVARQ